jgi:hypothetical protein
MNIKAELAKRAKVADDVQWRIKQIERTVARGHQDARDLESVLANGYVTKPVDEIRQMHIQAAKEIDRAYKPRKRVA